jgi:eukaryotic-like serine/threonine-protein kinase
VSDDEDPSLESIDSFLRAAAAAPSRTSATLGEGARLGHFVLERLLGEGGTGSVYLARDERIERRVAVKVLRAESYGEPERRRLLREARAAARVDHPRIATIYEVAEADGRTYLAMEYVEGESLRARLARGRMPLTDALHIARALADAVAAAHDRGVIHRDLKPENVLLTGEGDVRVVDFGLAKAATKEGAGDPSDTTTGAGEVVGTVGYMSPEQAAGLPVDARSDVFALGVVMYELLSGRRPFGGRTRVEIVVATTRDQPEALEVDGARWISAIVARCLEKDPGQRYASAVALLEALDGGPASDARRRRIRRRSSALLVIAIAATAVGVAALLSRQRSDRPGLEVSVAPSKTPDPSAVVAIPSVPVATITGDPDYVGSFIEGEGRLVHSTSTPRRAVPAASPAASKHTTEPPRIAPSHAPATASAITVSPLEDQK